MFNVSQLMKMSLPSPASRDRIFHEARLSLRVSGINSVLQDLSTQPEFLEEVWGFLRPTVETVEFESRADQLRMEAVDLASRLGRLHGRRGVDLGESQKYQIQAALKGYHYINPKLLLISSLLLDVIGREKELSTGGSVADPGHDRPESAARLIRGVPWRMYPMEMVSERPTDKRLSGLFKDMKTTLSTRSIDDPFRTLALWPEYLESSWKQLKPLTRDPKYVKTCHTLLTRSRELVRDLGPRRRIMRPENKLLTRLKEHESALVGQIVNVVLVQLDWRKPSELRETPFQIDRLASPGASAKIANSTSRELMQ